MFYFFVVCFFFSSRRRHTRSTRDWSSDVCSSDLDGDEPVVLGDRLAEACAAVAEDAALAVDRDRGRDRDRLLEGALLERHPRVAGAVAKGQVLQRALAALVADRTVERVVDEDELERGVLGDARHLGGACRLDDHPVLRRQRAAGLRLRGHPLDLDQAFFSSDTATTEPGLVAEDGDLDPGRSGGLDEPGALRMCLVEVEGMPPK